MDRVSVYNFRLQTRLLCFGICKCFNYLKACATSINISWHIYGTCQLFSEKTIKTEYNQRTTGPGVKTSSSTRRVNLWLPPNNFLRIQCCWEVPFHKLNSIQGLVLLLLIILFAVIYTHSSSCIEDECVQIQYSPSTFLPHCQRLFKSARCLQALKAIKDGDIKILSNYLYPLWKK